MLGTGSRLQLPSLGPLVRTALETRWIEGELETRRSLDGLLKQISKLIIKPTRCMLKEESFLEANTSTSKATQRKQFQRTSSSGTEKYVCRPLSLLYTLFFDSSEVEY